MQAPRIPRHLLTCSTIAAGICVSFGFFVATYAFVQTPNIHDVPVYTDEGVLRFQNKFMYLYWLVFAQVALFGVSLFHCIKWEAFAQNILQSTANFNAQRSSTGRIDVERLYKIICCAIFGFEFLILGLILNNALRLLNL
jgi:hypothetical protein